MTLESWDYIKAVLTKLILRKTSSPIAILPGAGLISEARL